MLITVALLLFKLEDKKWAWGGGFKSQWSALRGFNWQRSNSYIMPKHADLFCHTILFAKFNMLASFNLHFFEILRTPTWFSSGAKACIFPHNVWRDLFLKAFHGKWGTNFLGGGQIYWGTLLHEGLMIRSCQGQGSFTNAFSSNLKTVNLKIFANHEGYTLEYKALTSQGFILQTEGSVWKIRRGALFHYKKF